MKRQWNWLAGLAWILTGAASVNAQYGAPPNTAEPLPVGVSYPAGGMSYPGGYPAGPMAGPASGDLPPELKGPNAFQGDSCPAGALEHWGWLTFEGLVGWEKKPSMAVPLVTSSNNLATSLGLITQMGTQVWVPQGEISEPSGGARLRLGADFLQIGDLNIPLEFTGFFFLQNTLHFNKTSDANGNPVLTLPYFNIQPGVNGETGLVVSAPGLAVGNITVNEKSSLWGFEVNFLGRPPQSPNPGPFAGVNLLAGFRYLNLSEQLLIQSTSTPIGGNTVTFVNVPFGSGDYINVSDNFSTHNTFYGGQVGAQLIFDAPGSPLFLHVDTKLAAGYMDQVLNVSGGTSVVAAGTTVTAPGGIFAVPSNGGRYDKEQFCLAPEVNLVFGLDVCSWCRIHVGYDLLFLSSVVRPNDQVSRTVDARQVPTSPNFDPNVLVPLGPTIPAVKTTGYWIQAITIGLTLQF